ncbi:MAG: autotransporter domain-containing protein [Endomicrobia bacterium]|nr:autotransporter domain-containing protein [Endomicrobiia bacterium]MCL2507453.1 autotransporter domain-containing protein [Endomicrobiia bacterium]
MKKLFLLLFAVMFVFAVKSYAQEEVFNFNDLKILFNSAGNHPDVLLLNNIYSTQRLGSATGLNIHMNGNYILSISSGNIPGEGGAFDITNSNLFFNVNNLFFNDNFVTYNIIGEGRGGAISVANSTLSFNTGNDILFNRNYSYDFGGAIYANNNTDISFAAGRYIAFNYNHTATNGGAIRAEDYTYMSFAANNISFNYNHVGGYGGAISQDSSSMSFVAGNDISFLGNYSDSYGGGGAVYTTASTMTLIAGNNIYFNNNYSVYAPGGAIRAIASSMSLTASNIVFENNRAIGNDSAFCGALFTSASSISFFSDNIYFNNNYSESNIMPGGAIYAANSIVSFTAKNIIFENNISAETGGAIALTINSVINFNAGISGMNVTFKDNRDNLGLNDIYFEDNSSVNFNADYSSIILLNGFLASGGVGIINKNGPESLIFGANTVLDVSQFNINDGNIKFLDNATFKGPSMLLTLGNTLDLQNDSVNTIIVNNFESITETKIDIFANGDCDQIIAGNATVGGNLDIKASIGRYNDKEFEIILSTLSLVQGVFISTTSNSALLEFSFNNYGSSNAVILTVNGTLTTDFLNRNYLHPLTRNQKETARTFDILSGVDTISDELAGIITDAYYQNENTQRAILSQISGYFLSNVIRNAAADSPNNEIYDKIRNHAREDITNSGIWAQIKGGEEKFKKDENSLEDYKDSSFGIMAGFDKYIDDNGLMWGVYGRFVKDDIKQGGNKADGFKKGLGVYGGYIEEEWELKGMFLGSFDNFDTQRYIPFYNRTAKAEIKAFTINTDIEGALKLRIDDDVIVKPYLGMELQNVNYQGFKETGAGALNLDVKNGNYLRSAARLGAGVEYDKTEWSVYAKAEGKYILTGTKPEIQSVFENTNVNFMSVGSKEGSIEFGLGLGGEIFITENCKLFVNANFYTAKRYENIYGNIGVRYLIGRGDSEINEEAVQQTKFVQEKTDREVRWQDILRQQEEQERLIAEITKKSKGSEFVVLAEAEDTKLIEEAKARRERPMIKAFSLNAASFDVNSSRLTETAKKTIRLNAEKIKKYEFSRITIEGHTDSSGKNEINKSLSWARAQIVYEEFVKNGISADKIKYVGLGSSMPIATNSTVKGKLQNRRTEVFVE